MDTVDTPAPATIQDVARAAGCSTATVSRALNDHPYVSQKTRDAVLRAVREVNFTPLRVAKRNGDARHAGFRAAPGPRAATAGGIVEFVLCRSQRFEPVHATETGVEFDAPRPYAPSSPDTPADRLGDSFFLELFAGLGEEAGARGLKTLYHYTAAPLADPTLAGPDGPPLVLAGEYGPGLAEFAARCRRPLVLLDLLVDGQAPVVTTDNHDGIRQAMRHLFDLGHRRIAFAGGRAGTVAYDERQAAYREALTAAGLSPRADWILTDSAEMTRIEARLESVLADAGRPTAVVAVNDWIALAALKAAARTGLSVPKDLSVVGFDDIDAACLFRPALTTVRVDKRALGRLALRTLITLGDGDEARFVQRLRPTLVVRKSTGPA